MFPCSLSASATLDGVTSDLLRRALASERTLRPLPAAELQAPPRLAFQSRYPV